MNVKKGLLLVLSIFFIFATAKAALAFNGTGNQYTVTPAEQAMGGEYTESNGYKMRFIMGQLSVGRYNYTNYSMRLGYISRTNYIPIINNTAINAMTEKVRSKHAYSNDTLVCAINVTDKDVDDRDYVYVTWYKNNTAWYSESFNVNEGSLMGYYNPTPFSRWTTDNETILFVTTGITQHLNTTAPGNIEPHDLKHFDVVMCSAKADGDKDTRGWVNSTPIFIYNHAPDYDLNMPLYYAWPEGSNYSIDLGQYFSDIDSDNIDYYINWSQDIKEVNDISISNVTMVIHNDTGIVNINPNKYVSGILRIRFGATDYHYNSYGRNNTFNITMNVTQINNAPWASEAYIYPYTATYIDELNCEYTYNDIDSFEENVTAARYKWYKSTSGGAFNLLAGETSKTLLPTNFILGDELICSVQVKDTYYYKGVDNSLYDIVYRNSTARTITQSTSAAEQSDNIIIAIG